MSSCDGDREDPPVKINDIFERLCRLLTADSAVNSTSDEFHALNTNLERVEFAVELLKKYNLSAEYVKPEKDVELSVKYRQEGNEKYQAKKDHDAWVSYNRSIAYAPPTSDVLGLAYANRSAVLSAKDLREECLEDISRAFENNYPKDLHEKLTKRREAVENSKKPQAIRKYHEEVPAVPKRNPSISCASNSIHVLEFEQMGRCVAAKRDIQVGEVLAVEKPFAMILLKDYTYTHCTNCLRVSYNMIPCEHCPHVMYCSSKCAEIAWKNYHQYECPIFSTLRRLEVTKLNLAALRIALLARDQFYKIEKFSQCNKVYKSAVYEEIHFLETNTRFRSNADLFPRSVNAAVMYLLLKEHTNLTQHFKATRDEKILKELLLKHIQTGPTNFHEISETFRIENGDYSTIEIGVGAYSFLSLLNHSCNPNVIRTCYGTEIVLRAFRPIKKGQQLFDNYGYHFALMNLNQRRNLLKRQYYFDCRCEACEFDWPTYDYLPTKTNSPISDSNIKSLLKGDVDAARTLLPVAVKSIAAADKKRPCKNQAKLQETLKRIYFLLGNKWEPF